MSRELTEWLTLAANMRINKANDSKWKALTNTSVVGSSLTVLEYWVRYIVKFPTLAPFAMQIFSLVGSSSSAERNFSELGNIHSKLRNCLGDVKTCKLSYCRHNNRELNKATITVDLSDGSSDESGSVHDELDDVQSE